MRSRAKGLYRVEDLIAITERIVAGLQDAGVTHVADVAVYWRAADARGADVAVGTDAGPIEDLAIDVASFVQLAPGLRPRVLRPEPGRRAGPRRGHTRSRGQS